MFLLLLMSPWAMANPSLLFRFEKSDFKNYQAPTQPAQAPAPTPAPAPAAEPAPAPEAPSQPAPAPEIEQPQTEPKLPPSGGMQPQAIPPERPQTQSPAQTQPPAQAEKPAEPEIAIPGEKKCATNANGVMRNKELKAYLEHIYRRKITFRPGSSTRLNISGRKLPATFGCGNNPHTCQLEHFQNDSFVISVKSDGRIYHSLGTSSEAVVERICSDGETVTINSRGSAHPMLSEWALTIETKVDGNILRSVTKQTYTREDYRRQYPVTVVARTHAQRGNGAGSADPSPTLARQAPLRADDFQPAGAIR